MVRYVRVVDSPSSFDCNSDSRIINFAELTVGNAAVMQTTQALAMPGNCAEHMLDCAAGLQTLFNLHHAGRLR